ncbi:hypothetical protein TWF703_000785 [Orbilia oligospora]|uniref:Manganese/iron superoxide dismutase C-terminal domain-containing protein n=1 Tax=Orbilia oligospora TaxID=2813651 RepID=A0A7C8JTU5_ORBOL|nr:hypothetical protein TWF703_000785 [Orbilia oligospora]
MDERRTNPWRGIGSLPLPVWSPTSGATPKILTFPIATSTNLLTTSQLLLDRNFINGTGALFGYFTMPPPRLRPTSLLSGSSNLTRNFLVPPPAISRRSLFTVPVLEGVNTKLESGIAPVYSPHQFQIAWKEYQTHVIDRLNLVTAGTHLQNQHPLQVAILTSRDSDQAATFNYASMAHNNHFFFQSLSTSPTRPESMSVLMLTINESFGHINILKESFIATALACFSNAFVWLVLDHHDRKLKILTTYNSGTPYGLSHRRQSVDVNTTTRPHQDPNTFPSSLQTSDYSNTSDNYTRALAEAPLNEEAAGREGGYSPLLCVNVWEHAWLVDYGFDKKEDFLNNWWEAVDWGVVWNRLEPHGYGRKPDRQMHGGPAPVRDDSGGDAGGTRLADEVARRTGSR